MFGNDPHGDPPEVYLGGKNLDLGVPDGFAEKEKSMPDNDDRWNAIPYADMKGQVGTGGTLKEAADPAPEPGRRWAWPIEILNEQDQHAAGWVQAGPVMVPWHGGEREKKAAYDIATLIVTRVHVSPAPSGEAKPQHTEMCQRLHSQAYGVGCTCGSEGAKCPTCDSDDRGRIDMACRHRRGGPNPWHGVGDSEAVTARTVQDIAEDIFNFEIEASHNRGPEWSVEVIACVIRDGLQAALGSGPGREDDLKYALQESSKREASLHNALSQVQVKLATAERQRDEALKKIETPTENLWKMLKSEQQNSLKLANMRMLDKAGEGQ